MYHTPQTHENMHLAKTLSNVFIVSLSDPSRLLMNLNTKSEMKHAELTAIGIVGQPYVILRR